jgi:hypothetical protein
MLAAQLMYFEEQHGAGELWQLTSDLIQKARDLRASRETARQEEAQVQRDRLFRQQAFLLGIGLEEAFQSLLQTGLQLVEPVS